MILDEFVKIKINNINKKRINNLLNTNSKIGDIIDYPVSLLSIGNNIKVNCSCDICGLKRRITYQKYNESKKISNIYTCKKCSNIKRKETCIKKYGVENYFEYVDFKDKSLKTIKEKYGENIENVFQSEKIKKKIKETYMEKYGDYYSNTILFKEQYKKTCIKKYGVEHYFQTNEFINKSNDTKTKRYNNINYVNVIKSKETRTNKGNMISEDNLNDWLLYKRNVWRLTNNTKKELLLKWDGYDYYDNEYIRDYYNLKHTDNKYPTCDHKISVKYGFENNISVDDISNINNLCITKRYINSTKSFKTEEQFNNSLL